MFGEMREASYKRLNPRVETPVFITGSGDVLTETMAIAAWLEARDAERRISFDPSSREADRMHQLMAFINTGFTGSFSPLWAAMEMADPNPVTQAVLRDGGAAAVLERHDRLEEMLGETKFLVADHPTLADGLLIGVARWLDFHGVSSRSRWPKLDSLRARLEKDPAVRYATALEEGASDAESVVCVEQLALSTVIERYGYQERQALAV